METPAVGGWFGVAEQMVAVSALYCLGLCVFLRGELESKESVWKLTPALIAFHASEKERKKTVSWT